MYKTKFLLMLVWSIILNACESKKESTKAPDRQAIESPYLGQEPPGLTAEVFAPSMVSTELYELFSAFTPDMKEFYFVRYDEDDKPSMIVYTYQSGEWKDSVTGPRVGEPFISNDGKTMHLGKRYMERTAVGWSELKSLGTPYNDMRIMRLTTSEKGTYFFDTAGEEPIRYSQLIDGKRGEPQTLDIDLGIYNAHPWIAPDESYLIWDDQREEGFGRQIFISLIVSMMVRGGLQLIWATRSILHNQIPMRLSLLMVNTCSSTGRLVKIM